MKTLIVAILVQGLAWLATAPTLLTHDTADGDSGKVKRAKSIVVTTGAGMATLRGANDGIGAIALAVGDDDAHGWLGVWVEEVPESLALHLNIEDGVILVNVARGSPAGRAGLKIHDVVIAVDGESVGNDAVQLVKLIGSHGPGELVTLRLIHGGKDKIVKVTLGERPDKDTLKWIARAVPKSGVEETVETRGRLLIKGPKGEWVMHGLDELSELDALKNLNISIPNLGRKSKSIYVGAEGRDCVVSIVHDGTTILVERKKGGPITVKRIEGGDEVVRVYEDEDTLLEGDEEAYKLIVSGPVVLDVSFFGLDELTGGLHNVEVDLRSHLDDVIEKINLQGIDVNVQIEQAHEAIAKALEQMSELHDGGVLDRHLLRLRSSENRMRNVLERHRAASKFRSDDEDAAAVSWPNDDDEPRYTFTVNTDGAISARIRKDDTLIVREFLGEEDLAGRSKKLYKKFKKLMSDD